MTSLVFGQVESDPRGIAICVPELWRSTFARRMTVSTIRHDFAGGSRRRRHRLVAVLRLTQHCHHGYWSA